MVKKEWTRSDKVQTSDRYENMMKTGLPDLQERTPEGVVAATGAGSVIKRKAFNTVPRVTAIKYCPGFPRNPQRFGAGHAGAVQGSVASETIGDRLCESMRVVYV